MKEQNQLIVFDLDRTLLNKNSQLSPLTLQTLQDMDKRGIHYTIATGRSFLSAARIIKGHKFSLPQIYTNGVVTWYPAQQEYSFDNYLSVDEGLQALEAMQVDEANAFINAIDERGQHYVFHGEFRNQAEQNLLERFSREKDTQTLPVDKIQQGLQITNISMLGPQNDVHLAERSVTEMANIITYSGIAVERDDYRWLDIHHTKANKGSAIEKLKDRLAIDSVICFGDGNNDLTMFEMADECYAPANACDEIKEVATAVIGHHDDDGVAKFLREKFEL